MKDYVKFCKRYKILLALVAVLIFEITTRVLISGSVKIFQISVQHIGQKTIWSYLILAIIINLGVFVFTKLKWWSATISREGAAEKYRNDLYTKVVNLKMKDLQTLSIPATTIAVESAYEVADDAVMIPVWFANILGTSLSGFYMMVTTDYRLTTIILLMISPTLILFYSLNNKIKTLTEERRKQAKDLNNAVGRLAGFETIKSFCKEKYEIDNYKAISSNYKQVAMKKKHAGQNASALLNGMSSLIDVTILLFFIATYKENLIETVGKALLFYNLAGSLFQPFIGLPDLIDSITNFKVHLKENSKILEMDDEEDGNIKLNEFVDSIEFTNVTFSYDESKTTLENVNMKIPKGTKVGIYGPSGGGKSTFINLINRFFKVDSGFIMIDGIDINKLRKDSLRRIIGNVNQETFLFSEMTVKENIMYGISNCSEQDVIEAAKMANCHEFITKLPEGYNSLVGNNGVKLSGGEKQRIALARLFLLNPPILILDEATSKLDNESELLIKDAIDKLSKDKTVISIAHRFTTIENSDMLVGIKNHTIYECGDSEYIKENGELWNSLHK